MSDHYKFSLTFRGQLVENSVDAYDLANTILAVSQALNHISEIHYGPKDRDRIRINISAFKQGSLVNDFLIYIVQQGAGAFLPLLPLAPQAVEVGKAMLGSLKMFMEIKSALKGKPPRKVVHQQNGTVEIHGDNNYVVNISNNDFRALQDKAVSKSVAKIAAPLNKADSCISELAISEQQNEIFTVSKDKAQYLMDTDQVQTLPKVKYKGIVSKIDTKACSGFLTLGSNRLSFNYDPVQIIQEKFTLLVDSLRDQIQIYLEGEVTMDYEGKPRLLVLSDVLPDETLF